MPSFLMTNGLTSSSLTFLLTIALQDNVTQERISSNLQRWLVYPFLEGELATYKVC